MSKVLKIFSLLFLVFFILLLSIFCYFVILLKNYNLDDKKLSLSLKKYEFYDDSNTLFYEETLGNNKSYIQLKNLNKYTIDAFISVEDRNFYSHNGLNYKRILGATLSNVKSRSFKEGASTISQQLIKNTHLGNEKTIKRKLVEIKITKQLENKFTKDEILEKYLNTIYFGSGAYGINNASILYFNKTADKLTLNESACLAGIIKAPSKYSPNVSKENANSRKQVVLKCMLDNGKITSDTYNKLKKEEVVISNEKSINYFDDYVLAVKKEIDDLDVLKNYKNNVVKIYTNLNLTNQKNLFSLGDKNNENCDSSKIIINSKNLGVIAFIGKNSKMKRCPASTVKPWLCYAPMINDKYITESSVVSDEKVSYNGYTPKNYNDKYLGNVTIKEALKDSLNTIPCKLVDGFGIKNINKYVNKMNVNITNEGLPATLGAINGGLTLKEICEKYTVFSNKGNYSTSNFINKIVVDNSIIYRSKSNYTNVFSEETAYIISDILKEATKTGTAKALRGLNYEVFSKTGTNGNSQGNLDAYNITYTTNHIIGVWFGNENNKFLPKNITGGSYPTRYAREILNFLYKDYKPNNITMPCNIKECKINEEILKNKKETLIDNNGKTYFYISGTEPTLYYEEEKTLKILDSSILLKNNVVTIKNSFENCSELTITRSFKGKDVLLYKGKSILEFNDTLFDYGVYTYTIIFENDNGESVSKTLKSINYTKNNTPPTNWWDD